MTNIIQSVPWRFALVLKFLPSVMLILCLSGPSASVWGNREATPQCARRATEQIRQSCWEGAIWSDGILPVLIRSRLCPRAQLCYAYDWKVPVSFIQKERVQLGYCRMFMPVDFLVVKDTKSSRSNRVARHIVWSILCTLVYWQSKPPVLNQHGLRWRGNWRFDSI